MSLTAKPTCAVSVVIPMYNAEKYIGELLESILAQTFTDFEVIIADDCSTDSSCAIVESYMPKFNGRLKLSHMKKNSGGPGAPCNKAIAHARGKYIFQMDNDDLLSIDALGTFYDTAEAFQADVVHTTRYFFFKGNFSLDKIFMTPNSINKVMIDPDDPGERIKLFCKDATGVMGWLKFVRRDLLIENEIIFQEDVKASQDIMWTIELICCAKRYVRIPQPLYIHRERDDSVSHKDRQGTERIKYLGHLLIKGVRHLCKFFNEQKFFQDNPQYVWMLLDWLERRYSKNFGRALLNVSPQEAQAALAKIFKEDCGDQADLIAYLCTSVNVSRLKEKYYLEKINDLERRLKA